MASGWTLDLASEPSAWKRTVLIYVSDVEEFGGKQASKQMHLTLHSVHSSTRVSCANPCCSVPGGHSCAAEAGCHLDSAEDCQNPGRGQELEREDWGEPPGLKTELGISERIRGRLLC